MRSSIHYYLFLLLFICSIGCALDNPSQKKISQATNPFYKTELQMQFTNHEISEIINKNIKNIKPILSKNPKLEYPLLEGINEIKNITSEFSYKIDQFKTILSAAELIKDKNVISNKNSLSKIIEKSTIDSINFDENILTRFNNKGEIIFSNDQLLTRYVMIDLKYGDELETFIMTTRHQIIEEYLKTIYRCRKEAQMPKKELDSIIENIEENLPLKINIEWQFISNENTWAEYQYKQLSYAACMSNLEHHKLNAKISESILIGHLISLAGR